jgi:catechol 2,3-dioxygenase-like lactoylglutathione lyase family enzyme
MHHFAICVSDMQRSEKFYASILEQLGYGQSQELKDPSIQDHVPGKDSAIIWTGPGGIVSIWPSSPNRQNQRYEMYSPGLHHFALAADSREQVDDFYQHLRTMGANILNAPKEYDYMPGFYAVFFTDPDGIKLELCHTPDFPPR